jgi:hypothetical protein
MILELSKPETGIKLETPLQPLKTDKILKELKKITNFGDFSVKIYKNNLNGQNHYEYVAENADGKKITAQLHPNSSSNNFRLERWAIGGITALDIGQSGWEAFSVSEYVLNQGDTIVSASDAITDLVELKEMEAILQEDLENENLITNNADLIIANNPKSKDQLQIADVSGTDKKVVTATLKNGNIVRYFLKPMPGGFEGSYEAYGFSPVEIYSDGNRITHPSQMKKLILKEKNTERMNATTKDLLEIAKNNPTLLVEQACEHPEQSDNTTVVTFNN